MPFHFLRATRWRDLSWAPPVLVAVVFFVVNACFNARRFIFQADGDEGYALIQALLVGRGHPLYSETFSDQPPGYTYLVLGFTKIFSETPETARLLTILLVSLMLGAIYDGARLRTRGAFGHLGGILGVLLLVLSVSFVKFSCAAMIGLPALCFAAFSAWALFRSDDRGSWLALAGALLAVSIWIKPLTTPVAVAYLPRLVLGEAGSSRSFPAMGKRLAIFGGTFLGSCLLGFAPVFLRPGGEVLLRTHRPQQEELWPGADKVAEFFAFDPWMFAAGAFGVFLLFKKNRSGILALCWFGCACVSLCAYSPVWSHHRYLITIPAAMLVALGVAQLGQSLNALPRRYGVILSPLVALVLIGSCLMAFPRERYATLGSYFRPARPSRAIAMLDRVRDKAPRARLMATSQQMYAYRMGLEVPPSLAMTSRKAFNTGVLTPDRVAELVIASEPDIVIVNDDWPKRARRGIERGLRETHRHVLRNWKNHVVYIRK